MSQETLQWLNQNVLVGYTDKRGHAWHWRASDQGGEPNHYPGAIPVEDVRRRLFHWHAVPGEIAVTIMGPDGVLKVVDPDRKAIVRPDTGAIFGYFSGKEAKDGYQIHQFDEWLLDSVATILDDDLSIGSAGLLKGGAVAFVSVEVPDTIITPEGVQFRPHLLACTGHDGSLASTWKGCVTNTICDNSMRAALGEKGHQFKVKHSRYSTLKLSDAREGLGMVFAIKDDFESHVAELCSLKVSDQDWKRFLDELLPVSDEKGRGQTIALNKRDVLTTLWDHDMRVAPWRNTAWGCVQAVNTAVQHEWSARGDRVERNALRALTGEIDRLDAATLATVKGVLA